MVGARYIVPFLQADLRIGAFVLQLSSKLSFRACLLPVSRQAGKQAERVRSSSVSPAMADLRQGTAVLQSSDRAVEAGLQPGSSPFVAADLSRFLRPGAFYREDSCLDPSLPFFAFDSWFESQKGPAYALPPFLFFARFSFTRNFTMRLIRASGSGWSKGNCTEPFACLYGDSCFLNAATPEAHG